MNRKMITLKEFINSLNELKNERPELLDSPMFVNIEMPKNAEEHSFYLLHGIMKFVTKSKNQINMEGIVLLGHGDELRLLKNGSYKEILN